MHTVVTESVMVSDCGPRCKESRTTYQLKVEREWDLKVNGDVQTISKRIVPNA